MREFLDANGARWRVERISHGRTSGYLNPKVHRAVLQFTCLSRRSPRRYLARSAPDLDLLDALSQEDLQQLLEKAGVH